MTTVGSVRDAIAAAEDALRAAGCGTPRLDAEVLLADALGTDRGGLLTDPGRGIEPPAARLFAERVRRRVAREPVAYILGRRGFRRIELQVDRRVLVPRPETELLVEAALAAPEGAWVHDVGTGSGAVALALASERPDLRVTASDASEEAAACARENAARLGLDVAVSVAFGVPDEARGADLVVANMPYVREDEWAGLEPEITVWEPREALLAGADGLDAIREVVATASPGVRLVLEHAEHQAEAVRELLPGASSLRDLAGRELVTVGTVP